MSRALEKIIYKDLDGAAKKDYSTFIQIASNYHERLKPDQYPALLAVYFDVGKRFKKHAWSGKRDLRDVGYYAHFSGKNYCEDLFFATIWLTKHVQALNLFTEVSETIQEQIISENYATALAVVHDFQKAHGWSFWALEAVIYLTNKVHGSEETIKLAKQIRENTDGRIIGLAASIFAERVDDRYSVDNFVSKWHEIIPKYIEKPEIQSHYLFHALGISDLKDSLGDVILQDFSTSIFDCYNSCVESVHSLITSNPGALKDSVAKCIEILISAGINDPRLKKLSILLTGEPTVVGQTTRPNAKLAYQALINHSENKNDVPPGLQFIYELNENGAMAFEALGKLEKESLGLRFIPLGVCLSGFSVNLFSKNPGQSVCQPWITLLNSSITIEDLFVLPRNHAWELIEKISNSDADEELAIQAQLLLSAQNNSVDNNLLQSISCNSALWLGYEFIEKGCNTEVEIIIEHLTNKPPFWARQATKLKLNLLSRNHNIEDALTLAYRSIENNQVQSFEYPFATIFNDNSWGDFKSLNPIETAIVAHFTNATLESKDEDILYICKMACKRIHQTLGGKEILKAVLSEQEKKAAITLFSKVWTEENLTFLNFKTSREAMNERLDVLRLLVQTHPEGEQEYAAEIMDITLRESQWEGLSHVDETRIFVNEAGILRWADKELRPDFETWKKAHAITFTEDLAEEIFQFANSPTKERLDEIAGSSMSDEHKILLTIIARLENKFLNDPLDGLHCYLSARIRHGTIKNTVLGPLDEAGFLAVGERLDDSIDRLMHDFSHDHKVAIVTPALLELSTGLVSLINDALANKIRIKSEKHPHGFISIGNSQAGFSRTAPLIGTMLDFNTFVSVVFTTFWKLLEPSLQSLHDYFSGDFQQQIYNMFDQAIHKIQVIGDGSRTLVAGLTRIKNLTCQKCVVAAGWFQPHSNLTDRVFSFNEAISIATKVSKNIYPRFNATVEVEENDSLDLKLTAIGMTAIVEALTTLLENCWKYSGLYDKEYTIDIVSSINNSNDILSVAISNPLSSNRLNLLTPEFLESIRAKFQKELVIENIATEGGTGLPKIARLSHKIDRDICPLPLDIKIEGSHFVVMAFIPLHKRAEAYDVYNY